MENILIQAVAATMFAKVLVDAVKTAPVRTVGWVPLLLAFVSGQGASFLLAMSTGDGLVFDRKGVSTCVLVGILAFGSAVGVTELQKKAEELKAG